MTRAGTPGNAPTQSHDACYQACRPLKAALISNTCILHQAVTCLQLLVGAPAQTPHPKKAHMCSIAFPGGQRLPGQRYLSRCMQILSNTPHCLCTAPHCLCILLCVLSKKLNLRRTALGYTFVDESPRPPWHTSTHHQAEASYSAAVSRPQNAVTGTWTASGNLILDVKACDN